MLSIVLAVLAAAGNGTASVLQRAGARQQSGHSGPSARILLDLARRPLWLAGIATVVVSFGLQAGALATGPVALVQPVLVLELGFTLVLSGRVFHTRLDHREWTAVAGMSAGLVLLLFALRPSQGTTRHATPTAWLVGTATTCAVVAVLIVVGYRAPLGGRRAALLGVATGVTFGFTAVLVAAVTAAAGLGFGGVVTTWQTYLVVVVGPAGFLLLQNTLRAGRLVASQPGMTLANPIVAVGWGVTAFGERVHTGGWLGLAALGTGLIGACSVLLARSRALAADDHV